MSLAGKLGFVHRTLWQHDAVYRWALLLGPPPVLGCLAAALAWAAVAHFTPFTTTPSLAAPWAHWVRPTQPVAQTFTEAPTGPLPPTDARGRLVGFQPGWVVQIQPMNVNSMMEATVTLPIIAHFTLDQPTIPMAPILDAGPPTGLFAAGVRTFFPVKTPGVYAFSARFARSSPQSADCLVWLNSNTHRMVRNITVNVNGAAVMNFVPTAFRLDPGMFLLEVVMGCWRGEHMVGPGELTVMVRHPGESTLKPIGADEMMIPSTHADNPAAR